MHKLGPFLFFIVTALMGSAQDTIPLPEPLDSLLQKKQVEAPKVIDFWEPEPEFPGGTKALNQFIMENLNYPTEAMNQGVQGRVYVQFYVDSTGEVVGEEVVKGVHDLLDNEALRLVKLMPNWIPAELKGKKLRTRLSIPLVFKLDDPVKTEN